MTGFMLQGHKKNDFLTAQYSVHIIPPVVTDHKTQFHLIHVTTDASFGMKWVINSLRQPLGHSLVSGSVWCPGAARGLLALQPRVRVFGTVPVSVRESASATWNTHTLL